MQQAYPIYSSYLIITRAYIQRLSLQSFGPLYFSRNEYIVTLSSVLTQNSIDSLLGPENFWDSRLRCLGLSTYIWVIVYSLVQQDMHIGKKPLTLKFLLGQSSISLPPYPKPINLQYFCHYKQLLGKFFFVKFNMLQ